MGGEAETQSSRSVSVTSLLTLPGTEVTEQHQALSLVLVSSLTPTSCLRPTTYCFSQWTCGELFNAPSMASTVRPTICRLSGLHLSSVSCAVCQ